jgi:hypothetical protein
MGGVSHKKDAEHDHAVAEPLAFYSIYDRTSFVAVMLNLPGNSSERGGVWSRRRTPQDAPFGYSLSLIEALFLFHRQNIPVDARTRRPKASLTDCPKISYSIRRKNKSCDRLLLSV